MIFIFQYTKCAYSQEWKVLSMSSSRCFFFKFHCTWIYTTHLYWMRYACLEIYGLSLFIMCFIFMELLRCTWWKYLSVCELVCCVYLCMCGVWQHVYIMLGSCHTQREAGEGQQVFSSMTFHLIFLGFLTDPSAHGFFWLPVQQFPMIYLSLATTRGL